MDGPRTLIELGAVLIGLAVLARFAGILRIPTIPLYLLAGLAFGRGGLFPLVTTTDFIEIGAEIGLILLLFSLGLEYSARELVTTLRRQAPVGVIDVLLNFTPGFVAGLLLGWELVGAAALGGVTYVSSSGIAAKLLHDFGWTRDPESRVVVSLLVLEDLAMAAYLPVLAGVLIAGGFTAAGLLGSAGALVAVVALLIAALRVEVGITRFVFGHSDEAALFTILGLAIFVAGVAELVQISAAVGALLVGIVMSGPGTAGARQLLVPLRDFFAAMFFAFFGLSIDPSELPSVLVTAAILAIVTALTKFASGWLVGRRERLDARSRVRVGALLVARGEFSIVITVIAVASGLDFIGPLAAGYVLILAVLGPLAVRFVDVVFPPAAKPRPLGGNGTFPPEQVGDK
ncbi:MAG: cation:proton antiporter [Actinomycetota bacterium]